MENKLQRRSRGSHNDELPPVTWTDRPLSPAGHIANDQDARGFMKLRAEASSR